MGGKSKSVNSDDGHKGICIHGNTGKTRDQKKLLACSHRDLHDDCVGLLRLPKNCICRNASAYFMGHHSEIICALYCMSWLCLILLLFSSVQERPSCRIHMDGGGEDPGCWLGKVSVAYFRTCWPPHTANRFPCAGFLERKPTYCPNIELNLGEFYKGKKVNAKYLVRSDGVSTPT